MRNRLLNKIFRVTHETASPYHDSTGQDLLTGLATQQGQQTSNPESGISTDLLSLFTRTGADLAIAGADGQRPGTLNSEANQVPDLLGQVSRNLDQLRSVTESNTGLLSENTAALASNTAAKTIADTVSSVGRSTGGLLGGLTSIPLLSGLFSLFGGGSSTPKQAPLNRYSAPAARSFEDVTGSYPGETSLDSGSYDAFGFARASLTPEPQIPSYLPLVSSPQVAASTQTAEPSAATGPKDTGSGKADAPAGSKSANVTINIQALDSQSILDRSHDIAQAVREAMLNLHSINDVVNDL